MESSRRKYAATTDIAASKTRADIEEMITRYGAYRFAYGADSRTGMQVIGFVIDINHKPRQVKMFLRVTDNDTDQRKKSKWRSLFLVIKAKFVAIDEGITTFEEEFMSSIVLPDGQTMAQWAMPQIEQAYTTNRMPELIPGIENQKRLGTK